MKVCGSEFTGNLRHVPVHRILIILAIFAISFQLRAQSFFGSIAGAVSDGTGASIPGATVTATNFGTNDKRSVQSGANGEYRFVNLVPAIYRVEVEATSFKHFVRQSVAVQVDSTVRVDAVLQIGAATETVEVSTAEPLLETDSGSLGSEVEGKVVQEMPLNGRNTMNLIALEPGVVPQGATSGAAVNNASGTHTNTTGWINYQIGGGVAGQGAEYVDGATVNILGFNGGGRSGSRSGCCSGIQGEYKCRERRVWPLWWRSY
jgi:hypothetical protein